MSALPGNGPVHPGPGLWEQVIGTNVYYFHRDQLGSTRVLTDTSGTTAATFSPDAYGTSRPRTGT